LHLNIGGGERRRRSGELRELAQSVRDLITDETAPDAVAAYEEYAADIDRQEDDARKREDDRSDKRFKEA
jgi:hypothetical protein